jgi:hypothetical protein
MLSTPPVRRSAGRAGGPTRTIRLHHPVERHQPPLQGSSTHGFDALALTPHAACVRLPPTARYHRSVPAHPHPHEHDPWRSPSPPISAGRKKPERAPLSFGCGDLKGLLFSVPETPLDTPTHSWDATLAARVLKACQSHAPTSWASEGLSPLGQRTG